ncbi:major facilitator superfamily permease [Streptomyces hygroscopicus subsp. jinggangensis 5008]|nr:major facilitator superfamily permease [Streptomyces hygroscopicus subsp. jinggangensis 5008]
MRGVRQLPKNEAREPGDGRDFRFFLTGQAISTFGDSFNHFALPFIVFQATGSELDLGAVAAVYYVPYVLFGLVGGAIADRYDRRKMMMASDLARALLIGAIGFVGVFHTLPLAVVYGAIFIQSLLQIPSAAASFAAIPRMVPADNVPAANIRFTSAQYVVQSVSPVAAAICVTVMSPAALLLVDAASFLVSFISLAAIRAPLGPDADRSLALGQPARGTVRSLVADISEGLRWIWSSPILRLVSVTVCAVNLLAPTVQAQVFSYLSDLHASDVQMGIFLGSAALGAAVLVMPVDRLRKTFSVKQLIWSSLILRGMSVIALSLAHNYVVALLAYACMSGMAAIWTALTTVLRQQVIPSALMGRVASASMAVAWSVIPVGTLAGGWAASRGGTDSVFFFLGCGIATIACLFAWRARRWPSEAAPGGSPGKT